MVADGQDEPIEFDSKSWLAERENHGKSNPSWWWGEHIGAVAKSLLDAENIHQGKR
jgi:hypothetical protein